MMSRLPLPGRVEYCTDSPPDLPRPPVVKYSYLLLKYPTASIVGPAKQLQCDDSDSTCTFG